MFAPKRDFAAPAGADEKPTRGAYLVEGPGHCGACHTPRGLAYQEKALSMADGDAFLIGAVIDGWRAKSLRGEAQGLQSWSPAEIALFLKTGRTDKVAAFGAMADVVEHSTRHFADADLEAIAAYLKQLPPAPGKLQAFAPKADSTTAALLDGRYGSRGAVIYVEQCVACHRADGQGMPRIFPALAGNSAVFAQNPQSIIQITLEGGRMPANAQDAMAFAMPAFNHLSDQDITDVINFIRGAWTTRRRPSASATSGTSANSWPARSRTSSPEANNEQETETRIAAGRAGGLRRLAGRQRGRCAGHRLPRPPTGRLPRAPSRCWTRTASACPTTPFRRTPTSPGSPTPSRSTTASAS